MMEMNRETAAKSQRTRTAERLADLLAPADVKLDGGRPWDVEVRDPRFYDVAFAGSLAIGEAYMDGWWDCEQVDELVHRFQRANLAERLNVGAHGLQVLRAQLVNLQNRARSYDVGVRVYDETLELFQHMLDPRMAYSCAYWKNAKSLAEAQEAKLDLGCRKLGLEKGMRVLDIGCGWASFSKFAAERYGVEVVGVTVSREQAEYGRGVCEGLPVDIRYQDYREITGKFDRIWSAGMFEHVGHKNFRTYFEVASRVLRPDGLFLLHTIGSSKSVKIVDPWIDRYIFPNSLMPSAVQITEALEGLFVVEDWHNFGADYDRTLMAWFENFDRNWPKLRAERGEKFYRTWKFYLQSCAGFFRARKNHLWHIVLSTSGIVGGYESVR